MSSQPRLGREDAAAPAANPVVSPVGSPVISPVVSTDELNRLLRSDDPPAVLDVRWRLGGPPGIDSYLDGHLPGAMFIDLDAELSGPAGAGGRHPLPHPATFESAMRTAGLHAGQLAVAYDDADSTVAARLWWMLRYHGHERVAVLDGGYKAWVVAGLPTSKVIRRPEPGDFTVTSTGGMPVLDEAGAAALARAGYLLDSRPGERYRGEIEPVDRVGGHIPGAISAPTRENVGPDGRLLDAGALARRFASLGLPAGSPEQATGADGEPVVGAYCGSGVTAAHQVLALGIAGLPAALYVGSWSAWSADPSRPVATGPDPG
ncbi:MAG TPA: sulfurtransferase [Streptosporangiaceae bacterium]|nr:sulfurtransferase [Streptosporangiaceae bacterium]